ncbi:MAG: autotransporter domain-containing protein [Methyloceanibacter sp.]|nr:autotransporter domain-containing protein [Methyloceanibacter sp.]
MGTQPLRSLLLGTAAAGLMLFGYGRSAYGQVSPPNAPCNQISGGGTTVTCTGDVSDGILVDGDALPYTTLYVNTIRGNITPTAGIDGINFTNSNGNDITIVSDTNSYTIYGNDSFGVHARSSVSNAGDVTSGTITIDNTGDIRQSPYGSTIMGSYAGSHASSSSVSGNATAGAVTVTQTGDVDASLFGVFGRSRAVSRGGDARTGAVMVTQEGIITTDEVSSYGILAFAEAVATTSGSATSGNVSVLQTGSITMQDDSAHGIVAISSAQSSGVSAGTAQSGAVTVEQIGNITTSNDLAFGIRAASLASSSFSAATSGPVMVTQTGRIVTRGTASHGIFGRSNAGGDVTVIHKGEINVTGDGSHGIRVLIEGPGGNAFVSTAGNSPGAVYSKYGNGIVISTGSGNASLEIGSVVTGGSGTAIDLTNVAGTNRVELQEGFGFNGIVDARNNGNTQPVGNSLVFGGAGTDNFNLSQISLDLVEDVGEVFFGFDTFGVESGTWSFSGATDANFGVSGGTLGGNGTFGGLTFTGGTLAPGDSIGAITVNGAFSMAAASTFEVEVDAAGSNDKVIVNGTVNLTGATLTVLAEVGDYADEMKYTIIENDGADAVSGSFGQVSVNSAFLTPSVDYAGGTGNDVVLTLRAAPFANAAETRNQLAVAGALNQFPTDNALFGAIFNLTSFAEARTAFDALSGEVHASVAGTLADDSRYAREAVMGRMMQAWHQGGALGNGGPQVAHQYNDQAMMLGEVYDGKSLVEVPQVSPLAFWTQAYGAWGTFDGDGNAATADRTLGGFISGMDADVWNGWRVGVATGASFSDVSVDARYSGANTSTYHLGGYVGGDVSGLALRAGGLWAWSEIETSRAVAFTGFFERQTADYDADTGQLFGEIAYPTQMGGIELEPFAGLAYVSVETGSFRERGGAEASLRSPGFDQDVGYTTVGLRAAKTIMWGGMAVTPRIEAAWLHAFDDVTPDASLAFASTGIGFTVDGVPLAEDSALLDAGLDLAISDRLSAGVSYQGQYADNVSDNAVKGRFTWLFN